MKENIFLDDDIVSSVQIEESDVEIDEEAMIDIAEGIFERMAEHMIKIKKTVRETFKEHIYSKKISGERLELISRKGFNTGVK